MIAIKANFAQILAEKIKTLEKVNCPECGENITGAITHECYANGESFTKYPKELLNCR